MVFVYQIVINESRRSKGRGMIGSFLSIHSYMKDRKIGIYITLKKRNLQLEDFFFRILNH